MVCASNCFAYQGIMGMFKLEGNMWVQHLSLGSFTVTGNNEPAWFENGFQKVSGMNSSMHKVQFSAGFYTNCPYSLHLSYSNFANNLLKCGICIALYCTSGVITTSNIINNNSPLQYGIVRVALTGSYSISLCVFRENDNTLFYVESGFLSVSSCFIHHTGLYSVLTKAQTFNNSGIATCTFQLKFFKTLFCYADSPVNNTNSEEDTLDGTPFRTFPKDYSEGSASNFWMFSSILMVLVIIAGLYFHLVYSKHQDNSSPNTDKMKNEKNKGRYGVNPYKD